MDMIEAPLGRREKRKQEIRGCEAEQADHDEDRQQPPLLVVLEEGPELAEDPALLGLGSLLEALRAPKPAQNADDASAQAPSTHSSPRPQSMLS